MNNFGFHIIAQRGFCVLFDWLLDCFFKARISTRQEAPEYTRILFIKHVNALANTQKYVPTSFMLIRKLKFHISFPSIYERKQ